MTEREWYEKLSELVNDGISQSNKGFNTYINRSSIKHFVLYEETVHEARDKKRAKTIEMFKITIADTLMIAGYATGSILIIAAAILWLVVAAGNATVGQALMVLLVGLVNVSMGAAAAVYMADKSQS